jgi:hypothetical protein
MSKTDNKEDDPNFLMIISFMKDMNENQLERLCKYTEKLFTDKRYKTKIKTETDEDI